MRRLLTVAAEGRNTNLGTIEMNGTSTTRGVPGAHALERRRASPVATRWSHGTTFVLFGDCDNGASTLTFHALPSPSAASKFLALLVALVALSTANAATLSGSGGGIQYTLDAGYSAGTEELFATDISTATFSTWTDGSIYDSTFKSHIDTVVAANKATWTKFVGVYGSADFIGSYVAAAAVSPDFKT